MKPRRKCGDAIRERLPTRIVFPRGGRRVSGEEDHVVRDLVGGVRVDLLGLLYLFADEDRFVSANLSGTRRAAGQRKYAGHHGQGDRSHHAAIMLHAKAQTTVIAANPVNTNTNDVVDAGSSLVIQKSASLNQNLNDRCCQAQDDDQPVRPSDPLS